MDSAPAHVANKQPINSSVQNNTQKPEVKNQNLTNNRVTSSFGTFLEQKETATKDSGFTTRDYFKNHYIQAINKGGFENTIKAFILGFFFEAEVNVLLAEGGVSLENLKSQASFYFKCCKVQKVYKEYTSEAGKENFAALKRAYEAVLKFAENGDSTQHDLINTILNKHFIDGENLGDVILEKLAEKAFAPQGVFDQTSALHTTDNLLRDISGKYQRGYRGRVTEDENKTIAYGKNTNQLGQTSVKNVLNNEGTKSIFLAYARVYEKLVNKNKETVDVGLRLLTSIKVEDQLVKDTIQEYNNYIFDLIQNPEKEPIFRKLPFGLQSDEFVEELNIMTDLYNTYQSEDDAMWEAQSELTAAEFTRMQAQNALAQEEQEQVQLSFAELDMICSTIQGGGGQELSCVTKLVARKEEIERLKGVYTTAKQVVNEEIERLTTLINDQVTERAATQEVINNMEAGLNEQATQLKGAAAAAQGAAVGKAATAEVDKVPTAEEMRVLAREFQNKKVQRTNLDTEIQANRATLAKLQKASSDNQLIQARDAAKKALKEKKKERITLSHAEIAVVYEICDAGRLAMAEGISSITRNSLSKISDTIKERTTNIQVANNEVEKNKTHFESAKIARNEAFTKLEEKGFSLDEENKESFAYIEFTEEYKQGLKKHLSNANSERLDVFALFSFVNQKVEQAEKVNKIFTRLNGVPSNFPITLHKEEENSFKIEEEDEVLDVRGFDLDQPVKRTKPLDLSKIFLDIPKIFVDDNTVII
jgi:hypothetical protein